MLLEDARNHIAVSNVALKENALLSEFRATGHQ
jgi:hypothetical protein